MSRLSNQPATPGRFRFAALQKLVMSFSQPFAGDESDDIWQCCWMGYNLHSAGIYVLNNTKQPLNVNELIKAINGITQVNRINLNVLSGPLNPSSRQVHGQCTGIICYLSCALLEDDTGIAHTPHSSFWFRRLLFVEKNLQVATLLSVHIKVKR